jgi:transglutaminase/protease-like cytokinesis protein 3
VKIEPRTIRIRSFLLGILLVCSYHINLIGQEQILFDPTTFNYHKADSIALHFPKKKYKSYTEIVSPLTEGLKTDPEKARAIFRWITDNIQYNYGNKTDDADKVVKKDKAVCIGYSTLFKEMCNSVGIACDVIDGYSKTTTKDINRKLGKTDHAWNAVSLFGKWYLVDVTWATSYFDEQTHKFVKEFDEFYFLTPPDQFAKSHFPKDKFWQLLDKPISKSEFVKTFVCYDDFFKEKLNAIDPIKGIIHIKKKDTLTFKFFTSTKPSSVIIALNNDQASFSPSIQSFGDFYYVKQKFARTGAFNLMVFFNNEEVAEYKIVIK